MFDIFKTYDIRGVYPSEINEGIVFKIGQAIAVFLKAKTLTVGRDARVSSPSLYQKLVEGITSVGCNVVMIGQCTTPLFYFSADHLQTDGGVMVTASHVTAERNGLKIVGAHAAPIGLAEGLGEIEKLAHSEIPASAQRGTVREASLLSDYVEFVVQSAGLKKDDIEKIKKLKLVIDAGNGMTPLVITPLMAKLDINFMKMFFDIDCTFPNRYPDVSKPESLIALKNMTVTEKADLGVAFDGDGDRIALVDNTGSIVRGDYITALLFKYGSSFWRKLKVAYDFRFSKSVVELFGKYGVPMRVGHSFIKTEMRKLDLDMGGELSGHLFFKEVNYAESSSLAMLKILKILSMTGRTVADLVKPFQKYYNSGEINIMVQLKEEDDKILEIIKNKYGNITTKQMDGVTVDYWDKNPTGQKYWFNVRPSNTEPVIRLVVEADTEALLKEKIAELKGLLEKFSSLTS